MPSMGPFHSDSYTYTPQQKEALAEVGKHFTVVSPESAEQKLASTFESETKSDKSLGSTGSNRDIAQRPIWNVTPGKPNSGIGNGGVAKPDQPKVENTRPSTPAPSITPPEKPGSTVAPPSISAPKFFTTISIDQLREVNKNVEISNTQSFKVTDKLKYMFEGTVFVKDDDKSNAFITTKPIALGNGINLPPGTKITNSGDDNSRGRGGPVTQPGSPDNLAFTTPNGNSFKFVAGQDKKTGLPITVMEFTEKKSQEGKSVTFPGTPIFNPKSGVLTSAVHYPTNYGDSKPPIIYNDLLSRLNTAVELKREGWNQASKADVQKFFEGLK